MNTKLLSTLGLCKKAGKLTMGFDAVAESIGSGTCKLLVLASDLSPKSAKEIKRLLDGRNIPFAHAPVTMDEIQAIVGKRAGILAILDEGLGKSVAQRIPPQQDEEEKSV